MALVGYALCVTIVNCSSVVLLNDCPMATTSPEYPYIVNMPVTQWVLNGANEIKIIVKATGERSDTRIKATLETCPLGEYPGEGKGEVIASAEWEPKPEVATSFPMTLEANGTTSHEFGPWIWQDAPKLTLDKETLEEATATVTKLHTVLANKNIAGLSELLAMKFKEVAPCFGMTVADMNADLAESMAEEFDDPAWRMDPLDPTEFDFRLWADGRLIELVNRDGEPTLRSTDRGEADDFFLSVFLARIDGEMVVVR